MSLDQHHFDIFNLDTIGLYLLYGNQTNARTASKLTTQVPSRGLVPGIMLSDIPATKKFALLSL